VSVQGYGSKEECAELVQYLANDLGWPASSRSTGIVVIPLHRETQLADFFRSMAASSKTDWIEYTVQFEESQKAESIRKDLERMNDEANQLLSEDGAAMVLGVSPRTLQAWRYDSDPFKGPEWVKIGRAVRYRRGDVQAWIERNKQ